MLLNARKVTMRDSEPGFILLAVEELPTRE
jgi:hypothetical protein